MSVGMKQRTKVCCTTDAGTSKIGNHKEQLEAWGGRHCPTNSRWIMSGIALILWLLRHHEAKSNSSQASSPGHIHKWRCSTSQYDTSPARSEDVERDLDLDPEADLKAKLKILHQNLTKVKKNRSQLIKLFVTKLKCYNSTWSQLNMNVEYSPFLFPALCTSVLYLFHFPVSMGDSLPLPLWLWCLRRW